MPRYQPNERTRCPQCSTTVRLEAPSDTTFRAHWATIESPEYKAQVTFAQCPQCADFIITLEYLVRPADSHRDETASEHVLWPVATSRDPIPAEVPSHVAQDYTEAALVLPFSPKASAALSRRCLQTVLREAANTTAKDLNAQIDEVMPALPTHIAHNLDAIRVAGNFAAHPIKSQATGQIIEVEPGEAEWNLEVLDALFDFYYLRPSIEHKKREALNAKLREAGKPPLKE
jgi:hypothetical protein